MLRHGRFGGAGWCSFCISSTVSAAQEEKSGCRHKARNDCRHTVVVVVAVCPDVIRLTMATLGFLQANQSLLVIDAR